MLLLCRKKFSTKVFSSDCLKYNCTVVQYIGELCTYLVNATQNSDDKKLDIHYALGNGMRSEVWSLFQKRYNIHRIIEFYSATEGNIALFNSTGKVGALGMVPRFLDFLYPVR